MDRQFQSLPIRELGEEAGFRRPLQLQAARVTLESPALEVMTDFCRSSPATIRPQAPIEGANRFMISRGVRLLGRDCDVKLRGNGKPEFDAWRWHDYWVPVEAVIEFKREVYRQALTELHRFQNVDRRHRPRADQASTSAG